MANVKNEYEYEMSPEYHYLFLLVNDLLNLSKLETNQDTLEITEFDLVELINNIIEQKGTISKEFYIILRSSKNIQNDILKITEYLTICGNDVQECSNEEIIYLLNSLLNKRLMNITRHC